MSRKKIAVALLAALSAGMILAGCGGSPLQELNDLANMAEQYKNEAAKEIEKAQQEIEKATSSTVSIGTGTAFSSSSSAASSSVSGNASTITNTALTGTCWVVDVITTDGKTMSFTEYAEQNNMPGHVSTIEFISDTAAKFCDYENGERESAKAMKYSIDENGTLTFDSSQSNSASVSGDQMELTIGSTKMILIKGDVPKQTASSDSSVSSSASSGSGSTSSSSPSSGSSSSKSPGSSSSKSNSGSNNSSSGSKSTGSQTASTYNYYILPGSDYMYVGTDVLNKMSDWELCLARNEIFARRGRRFKVKEIQAYFDSQAWYNGTIDPSNFSSSVFNTCESANIDRILAVEEARNSPYINIPGDHISGSVPGMPGSYSLS